MKTILFSVLTLAFLLSVTAVIYRRLHNVPKEVVTTPITSLKISNKLLDIGEKIIRNPVEGKFTIYNTGINDLIIESVTPDCHCTGANFSKKPIKPNDSSQIILKYDSNIPGNFQSSATVVSNTQDSPVLLILRGNVIDTSRTSIIK